MEEVTSRMREVKQSADGMLPVAVYRELYMAAKRAEGGIFVEIGTYRGAGTLALALGAREASKPFHIWTVDLNVRELDEAEYVDSVRSIFRKFGVDDDISFIIGGTAELLRAADISNIQLLLMDADGRIDRDLALLYERLAPGASVIIDDVDGHVTGRRAGASWFLDQKHRISALLAQSFCDIDMLVHEKVNGQTGFYRKGDAPLDAARLNECALAAYRELVFAHGTLSDRGVRATARRLLASKLPAVLRLYRRLRHPEEPG